ncbi:MAG: hypothetical protein LC768_00705 [Acidobacteria bacterium]|nr:hypothetical protein [Acidobacteriota bacterium]
MTRLFLTTFLTIVALFNAPAMFAQNNQSGNSSRNAAFDNIPNSSVSAKAVIGKSTFDSNERNSNSLTEGFTFLIQDFKFNHQSELNNLNIKVQYTYKARIRESEYPDFTLILKDIQKFLQNYPDEEAYWEILNKKLTRMVLRKYPVLSSITSEMQVSPSAMIPYTRSTIVTRQRSESVSTGNANNE